eukprot:TCONS_00000620-protein
MNNRTAFGSRTHDVDLSFESISKEGFAWWPTYLSKPDNDSSIDIRKLGKSSLNKHRISKEHIFLRTGYNVQGTNKMKSLKHKFRSHKKKVASHPFKNRNGKGIAPEFVLSDNSFDTPHHLDFPSTEVLNLIDSMERLSLDEPQEAEEAEPAEQPQGQEVNLVDPPQEQVANQHGPPQEQIADPAGPLQEQPMDVIDDPDERPAELIIQPLEFLGGEQVDNVGDEFDNVGDEFEQAFLLIHQLQERLHQSEGLVDVDAQVEELFDAQPQGPSANKPYRIVRMPPPVDNNIGTTGTAEEHRRFKEPMKNNTKRVPAFLDLRPPLGCTFENTASTELVSYYMLQFNEYERRRKRIMRSDEEFEDDVESDVDGYESDLDDDEDYVNNIENIDVIEDDFESEVEDDENDANDDEVSIENGKRKRVDDTDSQDVDDPSNKRQRVADIPSITAPLSTGYFLSPYTNNMEKCHPDDVDDDMIQAARKRPAADDDGDSIEKRRRL